MGKRLFSINSWIFGNAAIDEIAKRAKEIGVDGIDISGEPEGAA
jgi:D-psicose/D-tagatose/L-ribulose 3-epimerase